MTSLSWESIKVGKVDQPFFVGFNESLKKVDQPAPQWLVLQLAVDDPLVALVDVHHCLKVHYE